MSIKVKQPPPPAPEIPSEVLASAIEEIAKAFKVISTTRLQRRTIVELIHAESGIARRTIEIVLNNLDQLEQLWLKPKSPS